MGMALVAWHPSMLWRMLFCQKSMQRKTSVAEFSELILNAKCGSKFWPSPNLLLYFHFPSFCFWLSNGSMEPQNFWKETWLTCNSYFEGFGRLHCRLIIKFGNAFREANHVVDCKQPKENGLMLCIFLEARHLYWDTARFDLPFVKVKTYCLWNLTSS